MHVGVKHFLLLGLFLTESNSRELFFCSQVASGYSPTIFKETLLWYLLSIIWKMLSCCLRLKGNWNCRKWIAICRNTLIISSQQSVQHQHLSVKMCLHIWTWLILRNPIKSLMSNINPLGGAKREMEMFYLPLRVVYWTPPTARIQGAVTRVVGRWEEQRSRLEFKPGKTSASHTHTHTHEYFGSVYWIHS